MKKEKELEISEKELEIAEKEQEKNNIIKYLEDHNSDLKGYSGILYHDKLEVLEIEREQLIPKIKNIIDKLYKKTNATGEEVKELMWCYNKYYKRNDGFGCSACVSRAYESLKNVLKNK